MLQLNYDVLLLTAFSYNLTAASYKNCSLTIYLSVNTALDDLCFTYFIFLCKQNY